MNKPLVFNYREYEEAKEQMKILEEKIEKLLHDKRNLEIRCRIAEMNEKEIDQKILDRLNELLEVEKQMDNKWISVDERMPDLDQRVIVSTFDDNVTMATLVEDEGGLFWSTGRFPLMQEVVIAWQPLPDPYNKGGEK